MPSPESIESLCARPRPTVTAETLHTLHRERLPSRWFHADPHELAPRLVGALWVIDARVLVLTEVESYGGADDPSSHAFRGPSPRNATMFGDPGALYVYFTYGRYFCANLAAHSADQGGAILIRSVLDITGHYLDTPALEVAVVGPARVCAYLSLGRIDDGRPYSMGPRGQFVLPPPPEFDPSRVRSGPRIGITRAVERPYRHFDHTATVSHPRSGRTSTRT
ncbi:MAG: DNA-3-methyladenine glycosylase [Acidimicrobiales bacterium]